MFHEAIQRALEKGGDLGAAMAEAAAPMREVIEMLLQQQPFMPFRVHMTGRYIHEIRRPETVIVKPTTLHIGEPDPAHPGEVHMRVILALIHVVSIEPLTADQPIIVQEAGSAGEGSGNG